MNSDYRHFTNQMQAGWTLIDTMVGAMITALASVLTGALIFAAVQNLDHQSANARSSAEYVHLTTVLAQKMNQVYCPWWYPSDWGMKLERNSDDFRLQVPFYNGKEDSILLVQVTNGTAKLQCSDTKLVYHIAGLSLKPISNSYGAIYGFQLSWRDLRESFYPAAFPR